ncbi:hypothetical protein AB0H83_04075 [Dactylosporangium sp. NPDC050688]|uniref:hypothetical protein n=1 Tax=Dactylosporangium sp. NPDC050688 TaxID=3157217 RepID=UPI0033C03128
MRTALVGVLAALVIGGGGLAGVMYGDFVAPGGSGGQVTRRLQTGTVTAVSADGHAPPSWSRRPPRPAEP